MVPLNAAGIESEQPSSATNSGSFDEESQRSSLYSLRSEPMVINPEFSRSVGGMFTPSLEPNSTPNSRPSSAESNPTLRHDDSSADFALRNRRNAISPEDCTEFINLNRKKLLALSAAIAMTAKLYADYQPIKGDIESFKDYALKQLKKVILHPKESYNDPKLRTLTITTWTSLLGIPVLAISDLL